jgi:glycosyltransferase involved in cell wall biosynthesis
MLISIIIPAYNSGRFIGETLTMLTSQDLADCEVIVVNDGSTDNTGEICAEFAAGRPAIRVITIPNSGVSVARNTGLAEAAGEYIYFLDSDDALTPGSIAFFKDTIRQKPAVDIFLFGYESRRNGRRYRSYVYTKYSNTRFDNPAAFLKLYFSKKINCHICGTVFSRTLLHNKHPAFTPGVKIGEDVEFLINAFSAAKTFYYHARICFVYKIRDDSAMRGYKHYSKEQFNSLVLIRDAVLNNVSKYPALKKETEFFMAFCFFSNYIHYIKSDLKNDKQIDGLFRQYDFLIKQAAFSFCNIIPGVMIFLFKMYFLLLKSGKQDEISIK